MPKGNYKVAVNRELNEMYCSDEDRMTHNEVYELAYYRVIVQESR